MFFIITPTNNWNYKIIEYRVASITNSTNVIENVTSIEYLCVCESRIHIFQTSILQDLWIVLGCILGIQILLITLTVWSQRSCKSKLWHGKLKLITIPESQFASGSCKSNLWHGKLKLITIPESQFASGASQFGELK